MNETLFYVFGIGAAVSAVVISFIGLKSPKFPGKAFPLVVIWFVVLAGGAATFSVLHAKDEEEHKAAEFEHAGEEIEKEQTSEPFEEEEAEVEAEEGKGGSEAGGKASGPGGTLEVIANESALLYEEQSLEANAGEVTINFDNPSAIGHDVAIEKDGEQIAATEVIMESEDSTTAELEPGDYVFYCTVPGHREAGMEGPLTVK